MSEPKRKFRAPATGRFDTRQELLDRVLELHDEGRERGFIRKDCGISEGSLQTIIKKHRPPGEAKPGPQIRLLRHNTRHVGSWITPNLCPPGG